VHDKRRPAGVGDHGPESTKVGLGQALLTESPRTAQANRVILRLPIPPPDPLEVFTLRASARARLWQAGEIDLHEAADQLQHDAEATGLVNEIGQDAVQEIMAAAFQERFP
jgi:hypothetical protein